MYMYDSEYNQPGEKQISGVLRKVVMNCMLQCNDLAQKLRQLPIEHNVEEVTLHITCDANTARATSAVGVANGKTGGPRRSQAGAAGLSALGHAGRRAAPPSAYCTVLYSPTPP